MTMGKIPIPATVVTVTYNSLEDVERCLSSVQATLPPGCEIIVVDNASSDGTARYVAQAFPQVRLVALSENRGFAVANNIGATLARGEYLVALNPDTEVTAGWVEALLAPLQAGAAGSEVCPAGMTTARILTMSERGKVNTCGNTMHISGITVCRGLGADRDDPSVLESREVSAVSGACFAMRTELWRELGGLDETFFTYLEDTDLSLRCRLAGYSCLYTPEAVVYHDYKGGFSERKFYHLERNRALMLLKSLRTSTLLALFPSLLLGEMVAWGYAMKSGPRHMGAKLRAYGWILRNAPAIGRMRRDTQLIRRVSDMDVLDACSVQLDMRQLAGPFLGRAGAFILNPIFLANMAALRLAWRKGSRRVEVRGVQREATHNAA